MSGLRHRRGSDPTGLTPLVVLAAALVLLAAGCGGETRPLPEGRALSASWSIAPPVALFGDQVRARVDLLVDRDELDPDRIQVDPDFTPFERVGDPAVSRRDLGGFTYLRYEYTVRCITLGCIKLLGGGPQPIQPGGIPPPTTGSGGFGERKTVRLKPAAIAYEEEDGKKRVLRRVYWADVQSVSRLNLADTAITGIGFPFRASVQPLPEATFRIPPPLLGAALLVAAAALLAFPALVVGRALRREPPPVVEESGPELTPLERALALVEWARDRPDGTDRRKALEVLAGELEVVGRQGLADEARALAWPAASPSPEAAGRLVETVREADGSPV